LQSPGLQGSLLLNVSTSATQGVGVRDTFLGISGDGTGAAPFTGSLPSESTILRVRGSLVFPKTNAGTANVLEQFSFGFGVSAISDNLSSSYPAPITDMDWDGWMFLRQSGASVQSAFGSVIDVKAMRKIQDGELFFIAAEGVTVGGTGTADNLWIFDLRLLLLLP